jgi:uncharacterized protein (TIGR03067 family)
VRFLFPIPAAVALSVGLLNAAGTAQGPAQKDLAGLQGTWTTTALTYNGKDFLAGGKGTFQFVIKGDVAVVQGNDAVKKEYARIKLKLDAGATPRLVDITVADGIQKDAVIEGIYQLKGDEFRLCARVFGKERPTTFASPAGSSIALVVMKRENP